MIILVAFCGLRILGGLGFYNKMPDWFADVFFTVTAQIGLMVLVPIIGMYIYKKRAVPEMSFNEFVMYGSDSQKHVKTTLREWGFRKPSSDILFWSIVLGVLCFLFNLFVASAFNGILAMLGHRGAMGGAGGDPIFAGLYGLVIMLILSAVLPGICEEVTHRGMLMEGFRRRLGIQKAMLLSSLLFGFMHLNIVQFFYATILGYIMAVAVVAMRNIWPAIIIHFMNNALSTYLVFAHRNDWIGGNFFTWFGNFVGFNIIFYFVCFAGLYFIIIGILHKFARQNFIEKYRNSETPPRLFRGSGMSAIKYYISYGEQIDKTPLRPIERAMVSGIVFLGAVITIMTFAWGML